MTEKYDVAIIGAGIGGLVCGCYLAKAGLKVVIVEQHFKPGGYCTSFERKGYKFDVAVHYLGGIKKGSLGKIFEELNLGTSLKLHQFDPTDKIIMPHNSVYVRAKINDTISEFQKSFPKEKENIKNFFGFILNQNFLFVYSRSKKAYFDEILDSFFKDYRLKSALEVLLGNMGVTAKKVSAVSAVLLFREFISDPGWYPEGGIQMFPDALVKLIKRYNGKVILSRKVVRIITENNKAQGIILDDGNMIKSKIVVSNADATETFTELLNTKNREENFINRLQISPSVFCAYIGLKNGFKKLNKEPATLWYLSTYNIEECYANFKSSPIEKTKLKYLVCTFPYMHDIKQSDSKPTMELLIVAPYRTVEFWCKHRDDLMEKLIGRAEELLPNLSNCIEFKFNATPQTFYRYTLNRDGAAYGWVSVPRLITRPLFFGKTSTRNLFFAGHWCNGGGTQGGISQTAVTGRTAARLIIENLGLRWNFKQSVLL